MKHIVEIRKDLERNNFGSLLSASGLLLVYVKGYK
jgi:hypothetical protein